MEADRENQADGVLKQRCVTPNLVRFMFWTNVLAVVFLLTGLAVPGWLTVTTRQVMTDYNDDVSYDLVYQDYAILYVTQCTWAREKPYGSSCDTRSYRLLEYLDERRYSKVDVEFIGQAELFFSGSGLVFSQSEVKTFQILCALSMAVSFILLAIVNDIQEAVTKGDTIVSVKKKVNCVILAVTAVIFTFVPVGIFSTARGKLHQPEKEFGSLVRSSLGIYFSGIGGALMIVLAASVLIWICVERSSASENSKGHGREIGEPVNENRQNKEPESQQTFM